MRQNSRYTLLFLQILLISMISEGIASAPPILNWQKCLGGSSQDMPVKIIRSQDGCILMLGSSSSIDGDIASSHGANDLWLTKTDSSGTLLWQKTYGGSNSDIGTGIIELTNGDLILSGYTASHDGDISQHHGNFDAWVIRTTSSGVLIWEKTFGGSLVDLCYAMIPTSDGGILIGGGTYSSDGDLSLSHGDQDFWLLKLDVSGNIIWQQSLGGSGLDVCYAIDETSSNEIIACGSSNSNNGDVIGQHGGSDFWVVKLSCNGTMLWNQCYGGSDQESALALTCTPNQEILITGYSKSTDGDLHENFGYNDIWAILIDDQNGDIQNQKVFGGTGTDISFAAISTMDGGFILAGGSTSVDGNITGNHGMEDIWLAKLDQNLNLEWEKSYGGSNNERPSCLIQSTDGGYLFSAYTYSNDGNVNGNHGSSDYWIVRLSCTNPQSIFSTPYDSLCVGMTASFSNLSPLASSYTWISNGLEISRDENTSITLPATGMYYVSLVAQTCYASDTSTQLISAIDPPVVIITTRTNHLCAGDSILLSATRGSSIIWNTGENTPSIYVNSSGQYSAIVTFSGCSTTTSPLNILVYPKPTVELGTDTNICSGTSLLLDAGHNSGLNYTWQDGSHAETFAVNQSGTYAVCVSNAFCSSSDTIHVDTVSCNLPVALFSVNSQDVCKNGSLSFTNSSSQASNWTWTFPGGNPSVSSLENPVVTYYVPGTYSVILSVSNAQGAQTLMRWNYIVVHELPLQPLIDVNGYVLSTSTASSYQWYLNTNAIQGAQLNFYSAIQDGFYQVRISDNHQCNALSEPTYVSITGIRPTQTNGNLGIFPNPAVNFIKCKIQKQQNENGILRVLDLNGKETYSQFVDDKNSTVEIEISLSDLAQGLYLIDFNGTSGTHLKYKIQKQ
ncbi:MAG: T9SS type A sorting domain-containing protein [Bacteroidetes bacterium]|nr:T9SS type A sorting domain-containing protein [Bacteroidota bacterium]